MFFHWYSSRLLLLFTAGSIFLVFLLSSTYRSIWSPSLATIETTDDRSYFPPTPDACDHGPDNEALCLSFPYEILNDVQVVVKTGIGERRRLEALLSSYLSCISNVLIVSDVEAVVDGHQVHDILADLPASYARNNSDWTVYENQHQALAAGETIGKSHEGWKLDRFKFLPMVEYAYVQNPFAKWYVFIETDTYLFWDTLYRLLKKLEPTRHHYLGTPIVGAYDRWFAYGGSGIVLSQASLRALPLIGDQRISVKYEAMVRMDCCGDAVLAYVLFSELGLRLGNLFPTFSGEQPRWVWISPKNWCKPLVSLHHLDVETIIDLWHWERCRDLVELTEPVMFSALLNWGFMSLLANETDIKSHWDNGAGGESWVLDAVYNTSETCFKACQMHHRCLQASYTRGKCHFAARVRFGQAVDGDVESSWDLRKLESIGWRLEGGESVASCEMVEWPMPQTMAPAPDFIEWLIGNCLGFNPTSRGCLKPNRHPP